jgi:uncharacterized repeat protein (TIGR03803 family)
MIRYNLWARTGGVFLLWAMAAGALPAQTLTTLYSFCTPGNPTNCKDGAYPLAALVQGPDGNFYGTGSGGGGFAAGTVFKITPSGTLTKLHSFDRVNGRYSEAPLVQGADGNLYGTTIEGGTGGVCEFRPYCGNVFKITPSGVLTNLHTFCTQAGCPDGAYPTGLVQGTDGNFYGTTEGGGYRSCPFGNGYGCGTVFKISPSGTLTTLYNFCMQEGGSRCPDGFLPGAGLVQGTDGNFYGTTEIGGDSSCPGVYGCGTIFQITPSGTLTTLHSFAGMDGAGPVAILIQATNGRFYGTTPGGGANKNNSCGGHTDQSCGTVFSITSKGVLKTLYNFCSTKHCADGSEPRAGLVQGAGGDFYGTTEFGGATRHGTAFKLTSSGVLTTLHNFCQEGYPCTDGSFPTGGLIQATNGKLYGTTYEGGTTRSHFCSTGCGTVFSLSVGLK